MPDPLVLEGCRPTPLASYLKALGILRLVAEQKDPEARGCWHADRFHLRTALDRAGLMRFFLEEYKPTPIIAPWNGRAGFLEGESDDEAESSRAGAQLVRAYVATKAQRFDDLKRAADTFASLPTIKELDGTRAAIKAIDKRAKSEKRKLSDNERKKKAELEKRAKLVKDALRDDLRAQVAEDQFAWLDACVRLADDNANSPLLIAGGADGSRDYGMAFGGALQDIFSLEDGRPRGAQAQSWWRAAVLGEPTQVPSRSTFGHLQPGLGGYNATTGYEGENPLNPWDVVLALEGAVLWAGGVTRRLGSGAEKSAASFPFSFEMTRAGAGQLSAPDRNGAPGEVWCPLWSRPTGLKELKALFREGRLTLGRRPARTGLEAALAVQMLGQSRGIPSFVRVGLYQSDAKMPHAAAPLGRHSVGATPDAAALGRELAEHPWLSSLRSAARAKEAPGTLLAALRAVDDSLFDLAARLPGPERQRVDARAAQSVLIAVGRAARLIAVRPKLQEALRPPPRLSEAWIDAADDGSAEFRLALALAGLRMARGKAPGGEVGLEPTVGAENGARADDDEATAGNADDAVPPGTDTLGGAAARHIVDLAMCAHLGPLDPDSRLRSPRWAGNEKRAGEGRALAVWGEGAVVDNLCAVAQRRLVEQQRRGLAQVPFDGTCGAASGDIRAFLDGDVDDARIADLLLGLAWVRPTSPASKGGSAPLPFAYAALKPLFTPRHVLDWLNKEQRLACEVGDLPVPPALPALLAGGRVAEAVRLGQQRAQASGLPTPFLDRRRRTDGRPPDVVSGRRLLAALVIPVVRDVAEGCLKRAYPLTNVSRPID